VPNRIGTVPNNRITREKEMINKLFNIFRKKRPRDNYDFIAMNIVAIYEALQKNYRNSFTKEYDLMTTSGIIDALIYVSEGSISLDELKNAITCARLGICRIGLTKIAHEAGERTAFLGPKNLLLNFILQIEAMLMHADNKQFSAKDIIYVVISKKKDIEEMVTITRKKIESGEFSQIYEGALQATKAFMTTEEFREIREELDFIKKP
jgi:hypothetical protein